VLLKNPRGEWELPGGRADEGEEHARTLSREFAEELALALPVAGRAAVADQPAGGLSPLGGEVGGCRAAPLMQALGCDLLVIDPRKVRAFAGMLERERAYVAAGIQIDLRILVQVARFRDEGLAELDIQGVSVVEVTNFHGAKPRSKNALCTVSPSARTITRSQRPPASSILAHRRIRPSAWARSYSGCATTRVIHESRIATRSRRRLTISK